MISLYSSVWGSNEVTTITQPLLFPSLWGEEYNSSGCLHGGVQSEGLINGGLPSESWLAPGGGR